MAKVIATRSSSCRVPARATTTRLTKNKKLHPEKMETKKYDPTIRKHVIYKEAKIK